LLCNFHRKFRPKLDAKSSGDVGVHINVDVSTMPP
jgi:hypothetical protein